jgi:hypothetical protein
MTKWNNSGLWRVHPNLHGAKEKSFALFSFRPLASEHPPMRSSIRFLPLASAFIALSTAFRKSFSRFIGE